MRGKRDAWDYCRTALGAALVICAFVGASACSRASQPGSAVEAREKQEVEQGLGPGDWASCFAPMAVTRIATSVVHFAQLPGAPTPEFTLPKDAEIAIEDSGTIAGGQSQALPSAQVAELKSRQVVISKGALRLTQGGGSYYLSPTGAEGIFLNFAATELVRVLFPDGVQVIRKDTKVYLVENAKAVFPDLPIRPLQLADIPLVRPLFTDSKEKLTPHYGAFSPLGVNVRIPRPASLDTKGVVGCVWSHGATKENGSKGIVTAATVGATGPGLVDLELPVDALRFWSSNWVQSITVALATVDGTYAGIGRAHYITPGWALVIATIITALLIIVVGLCIRKGEAGVFTSIFMGRDGTASISLLQMALWTIVAVWALIYVFMRTWTLLSMTPEVMGLLGFAGAATVGARLIASSRNPIEIQGGVASSVVQDPMRFKLAQLFQTTGQFDLVKLQLFVFTMLIAAYVLVRVLRDGEFPQLDPNFLLLMGITNGVYIANKYVGLSVFDKARGLKAEADLLQERVANVDSEIATLEQRKATLTQDQATATQAGNTAQVVVVATQLAKIETQLNAERAKIEALKAARDDKLNAYQKAIEELAK